MENIDVFCFQKMQLHQPKMNNSYIDSLSNVLTSVYCMNFILNKMI